MRAKSHSVIILLALILFTFIITTNISRPEDNDKDPNNLKTAQAREKPMIIWFHSGEQRSTLPLRTALSSGLITHVIVMYRNPADGPWYAERRVREAIKVVKKSDAKLIWGRTLWAWYKIENSRYSDLFDPSHYIREIQNVKAEAKAIGADFTALDTEPYGNSPMRPYMISSKRVFLSNKQHEQLKLVIKKVVRTTGKIDFIFPAGWWGYPGHNHPYDILATLGKLRIAENTYYDNMRAINAIKYPYEIFGVHLNMVKKNEQNPHNTYFLPHEIFERSGLWASKKGIFIYTSSKKSLAVAKELVAYSKTLPFRDSAKSSEPNRPIVIENAN